MVKVTHWQPQVFAVRWITFSCWKQNTNKSHFSLLMQDVVTKYDRILWGWGGVSFPNSLGLTPPHSVLFFSFSLSCSVTLLICPFPPEPLSSLLTFFLSLSLSFSFFLQPHTHLSLSSLGTGCNLERCRLMTVETWVSHSGLVFGNRPQIQTGTSDILLFLTLYELWWALSSSNLIFKSDIPEEPLPYFLRG